MFDIRRFSKSQQAVIKEDTAALSLEYSFRNPTNENDSFFVETCQFLSKMDQELYDHNKAFYGALCESGGNEYLIQESFSEWVDYAKKIVKKVIDFLKALLNKFLVGINMLIKREGYLKNHEKDFSKFKEEHNFHMNCFKFTIEEKNIPKDDVLTSFDKTLEDMFNNLDPSDTKNNKYQNAAGIRTDYDDFINSLEDKFYDQARAEILDRKGTTVSAGDYSSELFEEFRDGASEKDDTEITSAIINDSLLHFKNYHKTKSDLEKRRKNIEKEYNNISKTIEQSVSKTDSGKKFKQYKGDRDAVVTDKDMADTYELWVKAVANSIHELSSIHTMAFSARLDALKDRFSQDKTILYKALYRILGNINNGVREDADMSDWLGIEEDWKHGKKDRPQHKNDHHPEINSGDVGHGHSESDTRSRMRDQGKDTTKKTDAIRSYRSGVSNSGRMNHPGFRVEDKEKYFNGGERGESKSNIQTYHSSGDKEYDKRALQHNTIYKSKQGKDGKRPVSQTKQSNPRMYND